MGTSRERPRPIRVTCDPAKHDLARLVLDGGQMVLTDLPADVPTLAIGDVVELTDGVVIVAATVTKHYLNYGAWAFQVQPYLPRRPS